MPSPSSSSSSGAKPLRVAIVGTGAAGLSALWALRQTPEKYDIHVFEANSYVGGHTNTVSFTAPNGKDKTLVDTGFIVCNELTYPNFLAFLKHVGITPVPTQMTFSVSRDHGFFEWAGSNLLTVFAQTRNIFSWGMWRMIYDIVRFNHFALDLLEDAPVLGDEGEGDGKTPVEETIGAYLEREGYSESFKHNYLIPMTAAIWSTSPDKCALEFPAVTLVRFMWNHHLLNTVTPRSQWLTIQGGSKQYIDKILAGFPTENIHVSTSITSLHNTADGSIVLGSPSSSASSWGEFDQVILATHGNQALDILGDAATPTERSVLQHFTCSPNTAVLHSDLAFMPRRRSAWTSWNYITRSASSSSSTPSSKTPTNIPTVSLTYNMNILQHIPISPFGDVLVTLNPLSPPDSSTVQGEFKYEHPLYTPAAVRAQRQLHTIQGVRGVSFCGAWTRYGFHEDAFASGLRVAREQLRAQLPFEWVDAEFVRGVRPEKGLAEEVVRWVVGVVQAAVGVWVWVVALGGGDTRVSRVGKKKVGRG